ncbi:MAG: LysM peptidoglycan-binding domain-containing protein [Anaerolineae bacterium]
MALECPACGEPLAAHEAHCPVCGTPAPRHRPQRFCLHCGAPVAHKAKTCFMCSQPVDKLPRRAAPFSGSWLGILLGLAIIVGLVRWVMLTSQPAAVGAVVVPSSTATSPPLPTPTRTATATATSTPPPTLTPTATPTPLPVFHTVRTGETLLFIASEYNTTAEAIMEANDITDPTRLQVGQELLIPIEGVARPTPAPRAPTAVHEVEAGDTVSGIAFKYGSSIEDILAANPGLDPDLLQIGQEVIVPLAPPTPTRTPTPAPTPTHTPGPPYAAPLLLSPPDGAQIEGVDAAPFLNWTAVAILEEDVYYVVNLSSEAGEERVHWTQSTSWRLSPESRPARPTTFEWRVTVMRRLGGEDDASFYGEALSPPGQTRTFTW